MSDPLPVKIKVGPVGTGGNSIIVDGREMAGHVRGFALRSAVGNLTELRLDFVNVEVELDGMVDLSAMGSEWATYRLGQVLRDEMQRETQA